MPREGGAARGKRVTMDLRCVGKLHRVENDSLVDVNAKRKIGGRAPLLQPGLDYWRLGEMFSSVGVTAKQLEEMRAQQVLPGEVPVEAHVRAHADRRELVAARRAPREVRCRLEPAQVGGHGGAHARPQRRGERRVLAHVEVARARARARDLPVPAARWAAPCRAARACRVRAG